MDNKIIEITTEDLHFGGGDLTNGIYERVSRRIEDRNRTLGVMGLPRISAVQERNMLIGEIGEVAVRKDLLSRGYTIIDDSWSQFIKPGVFENVIDISAHDGTRKVNYQVKASECGNRSIKFEALNKCINSQLSLIAFVAVRQIKNPNGTITFEGVITSQMLPRHIPQLATWKKTPTGFCHVDNLQFIKKWQKETEIRNVNAPVKPKKFTSAS